MADLTITYSDEYFELAILGEDPAEEVEVDGTEASQELVIGPEDLA